MPRAASSSELVRVTDDAPKLSIPAPRVDVGEVIDGQKVPVEFTIRNDGRRELILRDFRTDCGCTLLENDLKEQVIAAGGSWVLKITFDSTGRAAPNPVTRTIRFKTNDPVHTDAEVHFDAFVKSWYRLNPPGPVTLMAVRRGDESRKGVEIYRGSVDRPLTIHGVEVPAELPVTARLEKGMQSGTEQHRIIFRAKDDAPLGAFAGIVMVRLEVEDKKEDIKISISGNIVGDIDYRPTQINLANQRQLHGRKLTAITLGTTTRRPFRILSIEPSSVLDFEIRPGARGDGSEYVVQPQIRADAPPGPFGMAIVIHTDSIDQPVVTIPVYGMIVPPLEMDPPMVRLRADGTTMGETRQVRLLSNVGGAALKVHSLTTDAKWLGAMRVDEPGEDVPHVELIQVYLISAPPSGVTTAVVTIGTSLPGHETFLIPVQMLPVESSPQR